jgi:gas vesicle protein
MNDRNGFAVGAMFLGLLIGLVIGAAATLMVSPKSGEEIRRDIRQAASEVRSKAEDTYTDVRHKAEKTAEDLRRRGEETASDIQKRAQQM